MIWKFLFIVVLLYLMPIYAENPVNMLKNGDFEEGITGWGVPRWEKNLLKPEIDNKVMQGAGMGSLKFVGRAGECASILQQVKPVPGQNKYRISGWIKTANFENSWSARIQVVSIYKEDGQNKFKFCNLITPYNLHDIDWTQFSEEFEIHEDTILIRVVLFTKAPNAKNMQNTGIVWFDNLSLTVAVPGGELK